MIEGKAAGMSLRPATQTAVQQIALPNVVERILVRQQSCSIHLSKADATSQAVKRLHAGNADGRAMVEQQEQRAVRTIPIRSTVCSSSTAVPPPRSSSQRGKEAAPPDGAI